MGDCAICMDAIDRPPEDASGKPSRRGARTRASYSLAPCAHLFVRFFLLLSLDPVTSRADLFVFPFGCM